MAPPPPDRALDIDELTTAIEDFNTIFIRLPSVRRFNFSTLSVLHTLSRHAEIALLATNPAAVRLLWEVCQIPDFRKVMSDAHARLLAQIYRHLTGPAERLPTDWVARQVSRDALVSCDRVMCATLTAHGFPARDLLVLAQELVQIEVNLLDLNRAAHLVGVLADEVNIEHEIYSVSLR